MLLDELVPLPLTPPVTEVVTTDAAATAAAATTSDCQWVKVTHPCGVAVTVCSTPDEAPQGEAEWNDAGAEDRAARRGEVEGDDERERERESDPTTSVIVVDYGTLLPVIGCVGQFGLGLGLGRDESTDSLGSEGGSGGDGRDELANATRPSHLLIGMPRDEPELSRAHPHLPPLQPDSLSSVATAGDTTTRQGPGAGAAAGQYQGSPSRAILRARRQGGGSVEADGVDGADGADGAHGADGADGTDGTDSADGDNTQEDDSRGKGGSKAGDDRPLVAMQQVLGWISDDSAGAAMYGPGSLGGDEGGGSYSDGNGELQVTAILPPEYDDDGGCGDEAYNNAIWRGRIEPVLSAICDVFHSLGRDDSDGGGGGATPSGGSGGSGVGSEYRTGRLLCMTIARRLMTTAIRIVEADVAGSSMWGDIGSGGGGGGGGGDPDVPATSTSLPHPVSRGLLHREGGLFSMISAVLRAVASTR